MAFLPVTKEEMTARGWDAPDFIYVGGDAYVDHPSFGMAVITRVLESRGWRAAVLAQPDWRDERAFCALGRPKIAFLVSSGNIDSMVAHYTAAKRRRSGDAYSPGGEAGCRPDRAVEVYCRALKRAYPDVPVVIGGIEASLRRFAHYDYWDDAVRPSILAESGADVLAYGMGERVIAEVADALAAGASPADIADIPGTAVLLTEEELARRNTKSYIRCAPFERVRDDKEAYAKAFAAQYREQNPFRGKAVVQRHGNAFLWQARPAEPLSREELDAAAALPYERRPHPMYDAAGGVPAIEEVACSIIHNRGCFGGCNFCALTMHQGRIVTSRSEDSVVAEAEKIIKSPYFKGYINDVGGPTANFRQPACMKQAREGACADRRCLGFSPCPALRADHAEYLSILRRLRALPGVKKVFVRSGIRFDYLLLDKDDEFFRELVQYHVSGQLKVAPEHCSDEVLRAMSKPPLAVFEKFCEKYFALSRRCGLEQYLVPYLMSSHPGSTLRDAVKLAQVLKRMRLRPEQVQDFYPTPGTASTAMFWTNLDPFTLKHVYVPRDPEEKALQRALLQCHLPEQQELARRALRRAGREDLIGTGPQCLVPPDAKARAAAAAENVGHAPAKPRSNQYIPEKRSRSAKKNPGRGGRRS